MTTYAIVQPFVVIVDVWSAVSADLVFELSLSVLVVVIVGKTDTKFARDSVLVQADKG